MEDSGKKPNEASTNASDWNARTEIEGYGCGRHNDAVVDGLEVEDRLTAAFAAERDTIGQVAQGCWHWHCLRSDGTAADVKFN